MRVSGSDKDRQTGDRVGDTHGDRRHERGRHSRQDADCDREQLVIS